MSFTYSMSPQLLLLLLWASPWIERKATFIGMDIGKEKYKLVESKLCMAQLYISKEIDLKSQSLQSEMKSPP